MGKYADNLIIVKEIKGSVNVEIIKTRMLQAIANELAEANRLKRIDLESKFVEQEIKTTPEALDKFIKSLEDKA